MPLTKSEKAGMEDARLGREFGTSKPKARKRDRDAWDHQYREGWEHGLKVREIERVQRELDRDRLQREQDRAGVKFDVYLPSDHEPRVCPLVCECVYCLNEFAACELVWARGFWGGVCSKECERKWKAGHIKGVTCE